MKLLILKAKLLNIHKESDITGATAALEVEMDDLKDKVEILRGFNELVNSLIDTSDSPGSDFMLNINVQLEDIKEEAKEVARTMTRVKEVGEKQND